MHCIETSKVDCVSLSSDYDLEPELFSKFLDRFNFSLNVALYLLGWKLVHVYVVKIQEKLLLGQMCAYQGNRTKVSGEWGVVSSNIGGVPNRQNGLMELNAKMKRLYQQNLEVKLNNLIGHALIFSLTLDHEFPMLLKYLQMGYLA